METPSTESSSEDVPRQKRNIASSKQGKQSIKRLFPLRYSHVACRSGGGGGSQKQNDDDSGSQANLESGRAAPGSGPKKRAPKFFTSLPHELIVGGSRHSNPRVLCTEWAAKHGDMTSQAHDVAHWQLVGRTFPQCLLQKIMAQLTVHQHLLQILLTKLTGAV